MSSADNRPTIKERFSNLFKPHKNVVDTKSRQQVRYTAVIALVLIPVSFVLLLGFIFSLPKSGQIFGSVILLISSVVAIIINKTERHSTGSVILVGGIALSGILISTSSTSVTVSLILVLSFLVPALTISILLLSGLLTLITAVLSIIIVASLPIFNTVELSTTVSFFLGLIVISAIFVLIAIFKDSMDNRRSEEVDRLRSQVDERMEERMRFSKISTDILEEVITSSSSEEMLQQAALLINNRFGFSLTRFFIYDEHGNQIILKAAQSLKSENVVETGSRYSLDPSTLLGWVSENKQIFSASTKTEENPNIKPEFLFDFQSEIGIPITSKDKLLGILDIESENPEAFENNEIIAVLQALSNQIGASLQTTKLTNFRQSGGQEIVNIYQAGNEVLLAETEDDINQAVHTLFTKSEYIAMYLKSEGDEFSTIVVNDALRDVDFYPKSISLNENDLEEILQAGYYIGDYKLSSLPYNLVKVLRQLKIFNVAVIPVSTNGTVTSLFVIGNQESEPLPEPGIQPYNALAQLISSSEKRIADSLKLERQLSEMNVVALVGQEISSLQDLDTFYKTLHSYISQTVGDKCFKINIFNADTNSIFIPYCYDTESPEDNSDALGTFPIDDDLVSLVINTRQQVLIVEDFKNRAKELGTKIIDSSIKSWLGTPLIVSGNVIGVMVLQDKKNDHAFDEIDQKFMATLASQVAGAIYNSRLRNEAGTWAIQIQAASDIARDISGSLNLGDLLSKAVTLIRERFNFYHAAVFLIDPTHEFAVIREATGDAGIKMLQASHKLKIGSKSIVGFVTSTGEQMVVNDTNSDPVYYANPLLPETRSEAAIPLILGTRIIGALDVQSTEIFAFDEDILRVLRMLSDQISVAIVNSELFTDAQENISQQRLLQQVTAAAVSGSTLEEALDGAVRGLQVTLGGDLISILIADNNKKLLNVKAFAGYDEKEIEDLQVPFSEGVTGWVASHLQNKRVNDVSKESAYISVDSSVCSELAVPLVYRGELLGVLNVESNVTDAYDENDEEMLTTLAGSLAGIISNARLIERVRQQVDREKTLFEVASKIRRSTDMQTIMSTTASELSKVLGAKRAQITLDLNKEKNVEQEKME